MPKRLAILGAGSAVVVGSLIAIAPRFVSGHDSAPARATLDKGKVLGNAWETTVERGGSGRTCFNVAAETGGSVLSGRDCHRPTKQNPVQMGVQIGSGKKEGIANLFVLPLRVHHVRLTHNGGCGSGWVRLERLSRHKARRAHVRRNFRYKSVAHKLCH